MAVINGTPDNDTINAPSSDDSIFGLAGNDLIDSGDFADHGDFVDGGSGNDTISGSGQSTSPGGVRFGGDDTLFGGTGDDVIDGSLSAVDIFSFFSNDPGSS